MLDRAGESQYYTGPERLAKLGYLEARRKSGKTRERTVYTLTDKGLSALRSTREPPVSLIPLEER
jgi:DNA-binding PadR family transcriptional regulator